MFLPYGICNCNNGNYLDPLIIKVKVIFVKKNGRKYHIFIEKGSFLPINTKWQVS